MVVLRKTLKSELEQIVALEQQEGIREYITPHSLVEHQIDFDHDDVTYLTIVHDDEFVGFIILVHHPDDESVECLRIAIGSRGQGIGQQALALMEDYCTSQFAIKRIWLDVFEHNARGIHVYTKLGYQQFDTGDYVGKTLLFMEKFL